MNQHERWMKRVGLLLLVLTLGMFVLSGCGNSPGDVSTTVSLGSEVTSSTTQQPTTTTAVAQETVTTQMTTTTGPPTSDTTGGAGALEVTGPSGTKSYTLDDLKAMTPVSGYWGAHKGDIPYTTNQYKGVALVDLLGEVGGLPVGASLEINTSDNFPCTYDSTRLAAIVNGTYQVWDKLTGEEGTAPVQLIVAYEIDGKPLPTSGEGAGPLRLVPALAADKYVTEGKYSPYLMVSVEVLQ